MANQDGDLTKTVERLRGRILRLNQTFQRQVQLDSQLEVKNEELKATLERQEQRIRELEETLQSQVEEIANQTILQDTESLAVTHQELMEKNWELAKEIEKLKAKLERAEAFPVQTEGTTELEEEISRLKFEIREMKDAAASFKDTIATLDRDKREVEEEVERLRKEQLAPGEDLEELIKRNGELTEEITHLREALSEQGTAATNVDYDELLETKNGLLEKNWELDQTNRQLQSAKVELEAKVQLLQTQLERGSTISSEEEITSKEQLDKANRELTAINQTLTRKTLKLYAINQNAKVIFSSLELDDNIGRLIEMSKRAINLRTCAIFLWDGIVNKFVLKAADGILEGEEELAFSRDVWWIEQAFNTKRPVYISDTWQEPNFKPTWMEDTTRSFLCLPLEAEERTIGIMILEHNIPEAFTKDNVEFLADMLSLVSIAIENSIFFSKVNRRVKDLFALYDAGKSFLSTLDVEITCRYLLSSSVKAVSAKTAAIYLIAGDSPDNLLLYMAIGEKQDNISNDEITLGEGIIGSAALEGHPSLLLAEQADGLIEETGFELKSCLVVPLLTEKAILGVLQVVDRTDAELFDLEDLNLVAGLASQASLVLANIFRLAEREV